MSLSIQIIKPTISECHKKLNNIGKISLSSISKLPEDYRASIRSCSPKRLQELAKMNCFAADKIKTKLDKQYGKNNYVLIAIGRSLSSITELMQQLGADTKIIPLSGLRRREINDIPSKDLQIYKTFLVQKGLSKTDLNKNKDKTYILMDYTYYGDSLEKAEKLLKKEELLGNAKNLISIPVKKILGEDYEKLNFKTLFEYCRFKDYSYVGKLHVDELNKVYEKCSPDRIAELKGNITQGLRKLFWFNVFDSYKENNFKNIMPQNELNAIYKHHLSPKALKNYLKREFEKQQKAVGF